MSEIDLEGLLQSLSMKTSKSKKPFIIAIDGCSGSGKSTLASALAKSLDAAIISGDDFYSGGIDLRDDDPETLAAICINWKKLQKVLTEIRSKNQVTYHPFDWGAFDGSLSSKLTTIEPSNIIILEGVYSNRRELRDLVDYSTLIQIDDEERFQRLMLREGQISEWERQWHRGEDWYFEHDALAEKFDILL